MRNIQKSDMKYQECIQILQNAEPDYVKIIHLGICALETLSGLCIPQRLDIVDHSYTLWTFLCRVYYEDIRIFYSTLVEQTNQIRTCVDSFLSEQCNISDSSTCPTTITATNYRLDCLLHKLHAFAHVLYKAVLYSDGEFPNFLKYVETNCETDPSFILSHIITAYTHLLGDTNNTIHPLRDGQAMVRLFEYIIHLSTLYPGLVDRQKTVGYEISIIKKELSTFVPYLFGV
jgi:hypothetical protein